MPSTLTVLAILVSAAIAGCQARPAAVERPAGVTALAGMDSIARATLTYATGTWDWQKGDSTCLGNRHTVTFSPDHRTMTITFRTPFDTATGQRVAEYQVLAVGSGIHVELDYVIRAAMVGESRRTDAGELVIWDLLLASPNRYHWHRTDWPDLGITGAVVRCDGTRPLEHWTPAR